MIKLMADVYILILSIKYYRRIKELNEINMERVQSIYNNELMYMQTPKREKKR